MRFGIPPGTGNPRLGTVKKSCEGAAPKGAAFFCPKSRPSFRPAYRQAPPQPYPLSKPRLSDSPLSNPIHCTAHPPSRFTVTGLPPFGPILHLFPPAVRFFAANRIPPTAWPAPISARLTIRNSALRPSIIPHNNPTRFPLASALVHLSAPGLPALPPNSAANSPNFRPRSPHYPPRPYVHRLTPGQPSHQLSAPKQPYIRAHCRPGSPVIPFTPFPQPAPKSPVRSPLYISAACVHRLTPGQPSHQVSAPRQPCIRAHCHPGSPVIPSTPFPQPTPKSPVRSPLYIPARRLHPSADRPGQPSHQLPTPIPTTRAPPPVPAVSRIPQSPFPLLQPPSKFRSLDRPPNPSRHSARNCPKIPPFLSLTPHSTPPSPKSSRSRHLPPPTCPTIPPPTGPKIRQNPIISV